VGFSLELPLALAKFQLRFLAVDDLRFGIRRTAAGPRSLLDPLLEFVVCLLEGDLAALASVMSSRVSRAPITAPPASG
jgi:hypothetical protein